MMRAKKEIRNMLLKLEDGGSCYIVAESLAELYSIVMWEAECVRHELGYLAEQICKQRTEGAF